MLRLRLGCSAEGWLPLHPVAQRRAAGAEWAARPRRQHDSIDFQPLVKGVEFDGGDGGVARVQPDGEGHIAEDVLGSEVDALSSVPDQLDVGNCWVV